METEPNANASTFRRVGIKANVKVYLDLENLSKDDGIANALYILPILRSDSFILYETVLQ